MGRGRLISLEGVDGAGTSTQASLLATALTKQGYANHLTKEPSDGPVGMLIRQVLAGRMVVPGRAGPRAPRMETMALLLNYDSVKSVLTMEMPIKALNGCYAQMITCNRLFSKWERIFKDPMAKAAATDRLVQHGVFSNISGTKELLSHA